MNIIIIIIIIITIGDVTVTEIVNKTVVLGGIIASLITPVYFV